MSGEVENLAEQIREELEHVRELVRVAGEQFEQLDKRVTRLERAVVNLRAEAKQ